MGAMPALYEPLFSNGLAFKKQPHFYPYYTGPRTSNLDGVSATAVVSGNRVTDGTLTLSGTVAGPIIAKPKTASQEAIYTFAIDAAVPRKPGRSRAARHIRYDAVVVVPPHARRHHRQAIPYYVQINNASTNSPLTMTTTNLSPSSVKIQGDTITITVPLGTSTTNTIQSTGKAIDQWNVNFFTRFPSAHGSGKNGYHSIASFTPENTMFQPYIQHFKPLRAT